MAHPNDDLLQGFLDAYGANDRDAIGRSLADDAVWHVGGTHRFRGTTGDGTTSSTTSIVWARRPAEPCGSSRSS